MYYCNDCEIEFDEPVITKESTKTQVEDWVINVKRCPNCGSEDIEEMKLCKCGEAYLQPSEDMCLDCYNSIAFDLRQIFEELRAKGHHDQAIIDAIDEWLENR